MQTKIASLLFSAWAAAAALAAAPTNSATDLGAARCLQKAGPAVVILASVDRRYERVTGLATGFLIREDGVLVTDRHVSEANDALVAFTADGKEHRVTGFYGEDWDYDVAVVKIEGSGYAHLSMTVAQLPQTNQWAAVVTPETNAQLLCVTGAVQTVISLPNVFEMLFLTLPVHPGQSGSPLLNESGEVIGVVAGIATNGGSYATPVNVVQRILEQTGATTPVPFAKRPRKGNSMPVVLDETIRAAALAFAWKDWAAAELLAKQAAKKFPGSPLTLTFLGLTYTQRGHWKEADAAFAKVVRLKPDSAFAWLMYGTSSMMRSRFAKADQALRRSITLRLAEKDQLTHAWKMIAAADAARKDVKGAREALGNLQHLDPGRAEEWRRELQRDYPKLALSDNVGAKQPGS